MMYYRGSSNRRQLRIDTNDDDAVVESQAVIVQWRKVASAKAALAVLVSAVAVMMWQRLWLRGWRGRRCVGVRGLWSTRGGW